MSRPLNSNQVSAAFGRYTTNRIHSVPALRLLIARLAPAALRAMLRSKMKRKEASRHEWTKKDARHPVSIKGGVHEAPSLGGGTWRDWCALLL